MEKEKTINFDKEYDMCVSCGNPTSYKKTDNIIYRYGYIQGAGQLCSECSQTSSQKGKNAAMVD
jgi:NAD(P)H-flavin reductase